MSLSAALDALPYIVEPMRVPDIEEVMAVDRDAFSTPWSYNAYYYEIERNDAAHYFVLRPQRGFAPPDVGHGWRHRLQRWLGSAPPEDRGPVLGYGGLWLMYDEAHISTIAIRAEWRGRGLGELLLIRLILQAMELSARLVTLEVRVSNVTAQQLYRKYGFFEAGRRTRYYTDNGEDAFLMSTPSLDDPDFRRRLGPHFDALRRRLLQDTPRIPER